MASTAATSATAIQVISVQDLYYDHKVNAGVAIFTLISSQLLGYGFAGLLADVLVKPTKCFWPATISTANLFQALHYGARIYTLKSVRLLINRHVDNQMTSKVGALFSVSICLLTLEYSAFGCSGLCSRLACLWIFTGSRSRPHRYSSSGKSFRSICSRFSQAYLFSASQTTTRMVSAALALSFVYLPTLLVFRNVFGGASNNEGMGLLALCLDWNLISSAALYNPIWLQINQVILTIFVFCFKV